MLRQAQVNVQVPGIFRHDNFAARTIMSEDVGATELIAMQYRLQQSTCQR